MLLEFGAKNFLSFNEGIEVSFRLNSNCPEKISKGKGFTNVLCVKGANGSGKSNVLKILEFLHKFCCDSFSNKPDEKIDIKSFFGNTQPSEFYIEFLIEKIQYRYELTLNKTNVLNETLYKKNKRLTKIFSRVNNEISTSNSFGSLNKVAKLRSNASIISTANQYDINVIKYIYNFFENIKTELDNRFIHTEFSSRFYYNNKNDFDFVKDIIRKCDFGINDISIIKGEDENNNEVYKSTFYHYRDNESHSLSFKEQSNGTKVLYNYLIFYRYVLEFGGVLVLDEFDINLHPHILPTLINLFLEDNINTKNAQLIFTTHNTEIMDYLGKYRTFLVNKENNESYGYRLDEIPGDLIRNDRPITPIYNEGKIGGIPKL